MSNLAITMKQPYLSTLVDPKKGSLKNKRKCIGEHFLNSTGTLVQVGAIGAGAYTFAKKPEGVSKVMGKFTSYLEKIKLTKFGQRIAPAMSEFKVFVKDAANLLSRAAKTHPYITVAALTLLTIVGLNHAFKAGKIDQKYNDKAQYEQA